MDEIKMHEAANLLTVLIATTGNDEPNEIGVCKRLLTLELSPEELREAFILARKLAPFM